MSFCPSQSTCTAPWLISPNTDPDVHERHRTAVVVWLQILNSEGRHHMAKQAIWVMLKAKPGKEQEVEDFLKAGAAMSQKEPETVIWYGVKLAPGMYGVFDTFNDEHGRDAHMNGEIAKALMAKAPDLF